MITIKDFFSFKSNRFFWLNLCGMVVFLMAVCYGSLFWLDHYTHHGKSYVVPDVKQKTLSEANILLKKQLLKGAVIDSTYVKGAPAGIIIDQKPESGAKVKEGRTIYLTITTRDVPLLKLPDIIDNSSLRQASAKLNSMGFKLTEPELVSGEQDWIYGIKYKGKELKSGDKVPFEATLTLCVGDVSIRDSLMLLNDVQEAESTNDNDMKVDNSWF